MKPFNLERAIAGDPVMTRDGRVVRQLTYFADSTNNYPLLGTIGTEIKSWTKAGFWAVDGDEDDGRNLVMKPIKKYGWVNVYSSNGHYAMTGEIYETEEAALLNKSSGCVATTKIEWSE